MDTYQLSTLNVLKKLDVCCARSAAKESQGKSLSPPPPGSAVNVLKAASKRQYALNTRITRVPRNCISRLLSFETPFIKSRISLVPILLTIKYFPDTFSVFLQGNLKAATLEVCFPFLQYFLKAENQHFVFSVLHY